MIVKCKYCDKEFNKKPSEIKKSKTGVFYCCKSHMELDKNMGKSIVKCTICGKEYEKKNLRYFNRIVVHFPAWYDGGVFERWR